jgi:TonB family protein
MPPPSYSKDDPYLKRLGIAAGVAAVVLLLGSLLGPSPETVERWILDRHIGVEGPTQILPNLDIVPDEMPVKQQLMEHMSSATQGLQVEEELTKPIPNAEKKVPRTAEEIGRDGYAPLRLLQSKVYSPSETDEQRPEMHARSQTSEDFVLEHYVEPRYPSDASPSARARTVQVRAGIYVDSTGTVIESYIVASDGGRPFDEEVLQAVRLWKYRPIVAHPQGFWSEIAYRFGVEAFVPRVELESGN